MDRRCGERRPISRLCFHVSEELRGKPREIEVADLGTQWLLVLGSLEQLLWSSRRDLLFRHILLPVRHRLCCMPELASAIRHSYSPWHWYGL